MRCTEIHALVHAGIAEQGMQPHAEAGGEPRAVHRRTHQPFLRGLAACVEELLAPAKRPAHHLELLAAPVEAGIKQLAGFGLAGFGQAMLEDDRSEEHTSELQSLMRISYAVFCLKQKKQH